MKWLLCTNWSWPATLAAVVTLLVPSPSRAHDYWFAQEPSTLEVGDTCVLRLLFGDELQAELEVTREGTALVVMDRSFVLTEGTYERFVEILEHEDAVDLAREVSQVAAETPMRRRYAMSRRWRRCS